jgi:hypothetical protein
MLRGVFFCASIVPHRTHTNRPLFFLAPQLHRDDAPAQAISPQAAQAHASNECMFTAATQNIPCASRTESPHLCALHRRACRICGAILLRTDDSARDAGYVFPIHTETLSIKNQKCEKISD